LGDEFVLEVEAAIDRIMANPRAYVQVRGEVRRHYLERFKRH